MILRNWINKMNNFGDTVQYKNTVNQTYDDTMRTSLANIAYADNYNNTQTGNIASGSNYNKMGIAIGSGTTLPTIDDYRLISPITSNINASGATISCGGNYAASSKVTLTQPIINNTGSNLDVSEIGVFVTRNNGGYPCVLLSRDVIPTATIPAGGSKTFVVSIDFAQMSTTASAS